MKTSKNAVLSIPAAVLKQYRFPLLRVADLGPAVDTFHVRRTKGYLSQRELRKLVDDELIAAMTAAGKRARALVPVGPGDLESLRFVTSFTRAAGRQLGIPIPRHLPEDMYRAAKAGLEGESQTSAWAANQSLRIGRVAFKGRTLLLQNTGEGIELLAEGNETNAGEPDFVDNAIWVIDFLSELIFGILAIAGARVKPGANVGEVVKKILTRSEKAKRALLALLSGGLTVQSIITFIKELSKKKDNITLLLEVLDCGFWGIITGVAAFGAKLSPGIGQALIAASIGILIGELLVKLARGPTVD